MVTQKTRNKKDKAEYVIEGLRYYYLKMLPFLREYHKDYWEKPYDREEVRKGFDRFVQAALLIDEEYFRMFALTDFLDSTSKEKLEEVLKESYVERYCRDFCLKIEKNP